MYSVCFKTYVFLELATRTHVSLTSDNYSLHIVHNDRIVECLSTTVYDVFLQLEEVRMYAAPMLL